VVVPETWFFRYPESYTWLQKHLPSMPSRIKGNPLRILSLPCSTGEEPYSIAMGLFDMGLTERDFYIDAADISEVSLQRAKHAVYGEFSFRNKDLNFRDKYFDPLSHISASVGPQWKLKMHVRQSIKFHTANVFEATPSLQSHYDIIFCRNLLIYFDQPTQQQVLLRLHAMLNPEGILMLGHAGNGMIHENDGFKKLNIRAFAYQRDENPNKSHTRKAMPAPIRARSKSNIKQANIAFSTDTSPTARKMLGRSMNSAIKQNAHKTKEKAKSDATNSPLEEIQQLANQGILDKAQLLCKIYTEQHPEHAEGWYWYGVIMQAQDFLHDAKKHFQKSIYLNPKHDDTLLQLALIAEQQGQHQDAEKIRHRMQKFKVQA